MLKKVLIAFAIAGLGLRVASGCDNTPWLQKWANKHHTDLAAATRFLDSHPKIAKRLDAKCQKAKHKKHHATPTPAPVVPPTPTPTPTSTPTSTPVPTPTPPPTATPTVTPLPTPTVTPTPTATPSPTCEPHGNCTKTRDDWRNTPEWPLTEVQVGNTVYTRDQCLTIMAEGYGNPQNGVIALAQQQIAAKLNIANGAGHDCIDAQVFQTDFIIGNLVVPPFGNGFIPFGNVLGLWNELAAYNKGESCCATRCTQ